MGNFFVNEDIIKSYLNDVNKHDLITYEDECLLAKRVVDGDDEAVELLVKANLRFVISVAKQYQGRGVDFIDLVNEGNYGLIKAAHKFDHTKGFKFISYAVWWVRQSMLQCLNENGRTIRLPTNVISKINTYDKDKMLYDEFSDGLIDYYDVVGRIPSCVSLDDDNDGYHTMYNIVSDTNIEQPDDFELDNEVTDELNNILNTLDDRERDIVKSFYGIGSDVGTMTLEVIGEVHGLTKERVRQIKEKAMRKLKFNSVKLSKLLLEY